MSISAAIRHHLPSLDLDVSFGGAGPNAILACQASRPYPGD
jgi:hypothetical protein